jgi:hypothetical protein
MTNIIGGLKNLKQILKTNMKFKKLVVMKDKINTMVKTGVQKGLMKLLAKNKIKSVFKDEMDLDEDENKEMIQSIRLTPKTFLSLNGSSISKNNVSKKDINIQPFNYATNDNNVLVESIVIKSEPENEPIKQIELKQEKTNAELEKQIEELKLQLEYRDKRLNKYKNKMYYIGLYLKNIEKLCDDLMSNVRKNQY